jgi:hypothetical protein
LQYRHFQEGDVHSRYSLAALAALAAFAIPTAAQAQMPAPIAPSYLLTQRQELDLTPHQVRELSVLAAQVRRYQQAVLRSPSKPWIAATKGTTRDVASERALALLSPTQRDLAMRSTEDSVALASASQRPAFLD